MPRFGLVGTGALAGQIVTNCFVKQRLVHFRSENGVS